MWSELVVHPKKHMFKKYASEWQVFANNLELQDLNA